MKKTLRMLCMGLAAATSLAGFAQEPQDYTKKVWNPDFEKGPHGWDITGESTDKNFSVWMPQVKGDAKAAGYLGHNNIALEIWQSSGTLKDNSMSQTITDLPNGTYVFGAYMMATNQSNTPNRELIEGMYLFANEEEVPVATNKVEGVDSIWGHSAKFNVAVQVTDGTLKIGAKCVSTNINFTTMDNVTLYYFGDMGKAAALDKMAQIDMQRSLAIADTCVALKADAESKAYLAEKMEAAKALTSAEDAWTADEELLWGMRQVRKSAKSYAKLATAIAEAKEYAAKEWHTEYEETQAALDALNALIAEYEAGYNEGTVANADVDSLNAVLAEAQALLGLDEIYTLIDVYTERVDSISEFEGDEIGQYSSDMLAKAEECLYDVDDAIALLSEGTSALTVKSKCEALFAKIQNIIDNPLNYYEFPIILGSADEPLPNQRGAGNKGPFPVLEGAYEINMPAGFDTNGKAYDARNNLIEYTSPLFRFREPLTSVRFYVRAVGDPTEVDKNGNPHICISGFAMFDENGDTIKLSTETVVTNANEAEGIGIPGILDYNPTTFFHTLWKSGTPEPHYIEVTLPEGKYSAFSFKMLSFEDTRSRVFPRELEITYVSPMATELQQSLLAVRKMNPIFGTAPGFYDIDPTYYEATLAEADAIANKNGVSDAEILPVLNKVNSILETFQAGVKLPEAGKKYRIISGEPRFMTNQNVTKALTLHTDTIYGDWLWWETASADSAQQEFILEPCESASDRLYYTFKHAQTGLYLGELIDTAGNLVPNRFVFTERRDSFYLKSLGYGQFGIMASDQNSRKQFNMEFHNNGAWSDQVKNYGAIAGVKSYIHTWDSQANQSSAWFFREVVTLPHATKSISELNFRSEPVSTYEGVNTVILTADKECAFADLTIYNTFGQVINIEELNIDGKVATAKIATSTETLAFSFTNNEGVETVTLDGNFEYRGEAQELIDLRNAYNTANNKQVVKGTAVGQVADTKAFDDAMMNAAALLENGGETEELVAAKAAIEAAVASLKYNLPVADQEYFIQSALPWMTRWNSEMDIFTKGDDMAYWGYVNIKDMNHRWKFVDCGQEKNGMPAYYLENVATQLYLTTPRLQGNTTITEGDGRLYVVEDTASAAPFNLHFLTDGKVAITDSREGNANGSWALHPMNHQSGTGYVAHSYMITWGKTDVASAMRIVEAEKVIADFMDGIEDVEIAGEQVAPAAKGIYDLYGRRIMTPAATGIYIVDGKKKVIKK